MHFVAFIGVSETHIENKRNDGFDVVTVRLELLNSRKNWRPSEQDAPK